MDRPALTAEGLVLANYGQAVLVEDAGGGLHRCTARKSAGRVVCGDRVEWQAARGGGVVTAVQPRRSLLERCNERGDSRPICANVDQFIIVGAVRGDAGSRERSISSSRDVIDCYLATAEMLGVDAILAVNKIDLLHDSRPLNSAVSPYQAAGYPVILTSAVSAAGIPDLRTRLAGRRSVLVGESGVGKSSLIKILLPDREVRIGELLAAGGKGRHTTTTTMLFHLPETGDIIDSPGVREFGLWHVAPEVLDTGFREFRRFLGACRYRDCRHLEEPGCAIAAAASGGAINPERLDTYRRILRSLLERGKSYG